MTEQNPSNRRDVIYQTIQDYIEHKRLSPTIREIADLSEIPRSSVAYYLDQLEGEGVIERQDNTPRSIRLTDTPLPMGADTERILTYVQEQVAQDETPSQQQIAEACYVSRWRVRRSLAKLEARGVIERPDGQRQIIVHDIE